jgi:hypothetical protein
MAESEFKFQALLILRFNIMLHNQGYKFMGNWKDYIKSKISDTAGTMLRQVTWQTLPKTLPE